MLNCTFIEKAFKSQKNINDIKLSRPITYGAMFVENYFENWRKARIDKLVNVLGKEWFEEKTVLELGCGFGHVGKEIKKLGSIVVFSDAREEYVEKIREDNEDSDIYIIDNDKPWDMERKFDLIIHWGLLYHLENWRQDLKCCLNHSNLISLETEVTDSVDLDFGVTRKESHYDAAVNGIGICPGVANIENYLTSIDCSLKRYDDADLNNGIMCYDWKEGKFGNATLAGHRRFWMVRREG